MWNFPKCGISFPTAFAFSSFICSSFCFCSNALCSWSISLACLLSSFRASYHLCSQPTFPRPCCQKQSSLPLAPAPPVYTHFLINFGIWCEEEGVQLHSFACKYPVVSGPFVEKTTLSTLFWHLYKKSIEHKYNRVYLEFSILFNLYTKVR